MTLAKAIGVPIRFSIWLGAILFFWLLLIPALLMFSPGTFKVQDFLRIQRKLFNEFVLWEET